jgi:hypothetical protein
MTELEAVREKLAGDTPLKELRLKAFDGLEAYWRAFHSAIYIKHPNYVPLVAAMMTQDVEQSGSLFNGPLPVFYSLDKAGRKKWGLADYRQLNDQRVAIVSVDGGKRINEGSLAVLMDLNKTQLKALSEALPIWMNRFVSVASDDKLIDDCQQEAQRNPLWNNDKALEFDPSTLAIALQELGINFLLESSNG